MKKTLLTGVAALFLATGAAHAGGHSTFYECGQYRIINVFVSTGIPKNDFEYWARASNL